MSDTIVLTPQGKQKLLDELEELKKNRRKQVAERISLAKEFGDLSENAEYHEAKDEQAFIEGRIMELEHILKLAHVVESVESDEVTVGSAIEMTKDGKMMTMYIVGATEADPANGKISLDSPLGQVMMGKKVGETFELVTPAGKSTYVIKKIS